jgi:hypothetical protein
MAVRQRITDLIRQRSSVRSFAPQGVPRRAFDELSEACRSPVRGPLGTECRLHLLEGVWSLWGTRIFLAGAARRGAHCLEDYGRLLEELVLRATGLSLGTCWIGLGFPQAAFASALSLGADELVPAVVAVGVPSGLKTLYHRAARLVTRAVRRKPWDELFFDGDFSTPLPSQRAAHPYQQALEMVRLAPSSQNRQPWRVLRSGASGRPRFHFYGQRPAVPLGSRTEWLRLDVGIAMAHFELTMMEAGMRGRWAAEARPPAGLLPPRTDYVASWLPEQPA